MTATRTTPVAAGPGLEECVREQCSLAQTFQRILPAVPRETGAQGLAVTTRNEELAEQTFHAGDFGAH